MPVRKLYQAFCGKISLGLASPRNNVRQLLDIALAISDLLSLWGHVENVIDGRLIVFASTGSFTLDLI